MFNFINTMHCTFFKNSENYFCCFGSIPIMAVGRLMSVLMLLIMTLWTVKFMVLGEWSLPAIAGALMVVVYGSFTFGAFKNRRRFLIPAIITNMLLILIWVSRTVILVYSANIYSKTPENRAIFRKALNWTDEYGYWSIIVWLVIRKTFYIGVLLWLTHVGWRCYYYLSKTDGGTIVPMQKEDPTPVYTTA